MNTLINTVVIKTTDHAPVRKSLAEWIDLYSDQLEPGFKFRLYRINDVDDEAADGHPLYNKGLERYRAHIIENSS